MKYSEQIHTKLKGIIWSEKEYKNVLILSLLRMNKEKKKKYFLKNSGHILINNI